MLLYIDSYGLTPKRVYTSWFMVLLALVFLAVLLRQIFKRFPSACVILIGTLALVALIALPNVDGMIAEYNVDAYVAGKISEIDVETLDSLGDSAVPVMVELETELEGRSNRSDEENAVLEDLRPRLDRIEKEVQEEKLTLFSFSIPKFQAHRSIKQR